VTRLDLLWSSVDNDMYSAALAVFLPPFYH
jgi:hypothetical protein